ncbi:MAG: hypothetical protein GY754_15995, partial [bacterium]|nr:hypothetical protein [bacterium]
MPAALSVHDRLSLQNLCDLISLNSDRGGIYFLVSPEEKLVEVFDFFEKNLTPITLEEMDLPPFLDLLVRVDFLLEKAPGLSKERLFFASIHNLNPHQLDKLLQSLNVRREFIPRKHINLLVALDEKHFSEVQRTA